MWHAFSRCVSAFGIWKCQVLTVPNVCIESSIHGCSPQSDTWEIKILHHSSTCPDAAAG
ncbi:unnamed protein product [Mycena citricolor]|uniref:Uncharacterized protein n=1 Tax=Mycena citricolor TaxID=2018698 RepID=A0AAD2GRP3_9AGAR|nr:unnamed protein product [Mycena citricolor]